MKIAIVKSCGALDMVKDFKRATAGTGLGRATHSPSGRVERKADHVKTNSTYLPGE